MRRLPFVALVVATTSCSAAYSWDEYTNGATAPDGGATTDAGVIEEAGASSSSGGVDAAPPVEAGACASGARLTGTAFDATPGGRGRACRVPEVVTEDELWAALDTADEGAASTIDGQNVSGCIGVELAEAFVLREVGFRLTPHHDGCGDSPCSGTSCGTGHGVELFAGATRTALRHLQRTTVDELRTVLVPSEVVGGEPVRVLVVCRDAAGGARDDMLVDAIYGVCK